MAQLLKGDLNTQTNIVELKLAQEGAIDAVTTTSNNYSTRLALFDGTDQEQQTTLITGAENLTWGNGALNIPGDITLTGTINNRNIVTDGAALDAAVAKLAGIANGAEVNVNADWTSATGDSQILNKPTIVLSSNGSLIGEDITDSNLISPLAVKTYVDGRVTSSLNYKGGYNPNAAPEALENSPSPALLGDTYTIIEDGFFNGVSVSIGDVIIAETDGAGPDINDWTIVSKQLDVATEGTPGIVTLAPSGSIDGNLVVTGDDTRLADAASALQDGDILTTGLEFPATGLKIQDADSPQHALTISHEGSADSTLTIDTSDTNRTLTFTGDATISGTNTGDVTLQDDNTPDVTFLSLTNQVLTVDKVHLSTDVTGSLALSSLNTTGSAESTTFLRGDGAWASIPTTTVANDSIWAEKGDLVVGTNNNSASLLSIGDSGQVLKVYEETPGGDLNIRWETPSEGHAAVTLNGGVLEPLNYLSINNQEITLNQIDLSTDVTGILNISNLPGNLGATTLDELTDVNLSITIETDDGTAGGTWAGTDPVSFVEYGTYGGQTSYSSTATVGGNTLYLWWDGAEWIISETLPGGDFTSDIYRASGSTTADDPLGTYSDLGFQPGVGFEPTLGIDGANLIGSDLSATDGQILRYNSTASEWRANDFIVDLTTEVTGPATFVNAANGVNEITITDAATGSGPDISASGADQNVELNIGSKGAANVNINAQGVVQSNGDFNTPGDAQTATYILRTTTSGTIEEEMFFDGSTGGISVPNNSTIMYRALIIGRATTGDISGAYELQGAVNNNAGTTDVLGTQIRTVFAEDNSDWDVTIIADTNNDRLTFKVTGAPVGTDVKWVARVDTVSCITS